MKQMEAWNRLRKETNLKLPPSFLYSRDMMWRRSFGKKWYKDKKEMYILLTSLNHETVITLEEPDDCNRFHVAIRGLSESTARQALVSEQVGQFVSREAAGIKVTALRRLASGRVGSDWPTR